MAHPAAGETPGINERTSRHLSGALALDQPPVALAFLDDPPAGLPIRRETPPSLCALWRPAAESIFYAPSDTHLGCPVGALTLGIPLSGPARAQLAAAASAMGAAGYLAETETGHLPVLPRSPAGVLYGPLAAFPVAPDLVLCWLTARGAMLAAEAIGAVRWDEAGGLRLTGRPGCAALPLADSSGRPAFSLGCTGMRGRTGIGDEHLLAVLPRAALSRFAEGLTAAAAANAAMDSYYGAAASAR